MANYAQVTIWDRLTTAANAKTLPAVADLSASWELSRVGLLSFRVPYRDAIHAGLRMDTLLAKWISYTHPILGTWGGSINSFSGEDGYITINAESWEAGLRGFTGLGGTSAVPQGIVSNVNNGTSQHGITAVLTDQQIGNTRAVDWFRADSDLLDSIFGQSLLFFMSQQFINPTNRPPEGFRVMPDTRRFVARDRFGQDRRATVKFADRVNLVSSSFSDDLSDVFSVVRLTAQYKKPVTHQLDTSHCVQCLPCKEESSDKGKKKKGKKKKKKGKVTTKPMGTPPNCNCGCAKTEPDTQQVNEDTSYTAIYEIPGMVAKYGRRYVDLTPYTAAGESDDTVYATQQNIINIAQTVAIDYTYNRQLVTVELPYTSGLWTMFGLGDLVSVELGNSGVYGAMVVRAMGVDVARDVLSVSGEADLLNL
jgi:hypothetical protein